MSGQLTSRGWAGKASAGLVLGFMLALGLCGLFATFGPGDLSYMSTQGQVTMWLMSPLWAGVLSLCFLFRTGLRAWVGLGLANLLVWAPLVVAGAVNL